MRSLYIIGSLYVASSALVVLTHATPPSMQVHPGASIEATPYTGSAGAWFSGMKQYCNALEVESAHRRTPPPDTEEGAGYSAACFALAGRIDEARRVIVQQPQSRQWAVAGMVFNVGHPVADAGDDKSAGPIMELVVEFWPNHYQALYHAGMSAYILGQPERARTRLEQFLQYYDTKDGWHRNAVTVLKRLDER